MQLNYKPFVGQPVIALRDLYTSGITQGEEVTIKGIIECPECKEILLDVGVKKQMASSSTCKYCGDVQSYKQGDPMYLFANNFTPKTFSN